MNDEQMMKKRRDEFSVDEANIWIKNATWIKIKQDYVDSFEWRVE